MKFFRDKRVGLSAEPGFRSRSLTVASIALLLLSLLTGCSGTGGTTTSGRVGGGSPIAVVGAEVMKRLSLSPSSLNLGDVPVGFSVSQVITLANSGNTTVSVTAVNLTGPGFSQDLMAPFMLAPGQTRSFNLSFSPTAGGTVMGGLSIISDAENTPTVLTLLGNGITSTNASLAISPSSIAFGDTVVGVGATQTVNLINSGTTAVMVSSVTVAGSAFSVTGVAVPFSLNPGQTFSFSVQFFPMAAGAAMGSISVTHDGLGSPSVAALSGNGIAPTVTLSATPPTVDFGNVSVGASDTRTVTVSNTGNADLTLTAVNVTGAAFATTGLTLPLTLTPGQSSSFGARFSPAATGSVVGSLSIVSNASNSPTPVTLSGTGVAPPAGVLNASPASVSFGDVIVGNAVTQAVTLTNTGNADLTITAAPVTGAGFSVMGLTLPLTLTPNQSTAFTARFAPTAAGAANGNISFTSNASNSPTAVTLSGNALAQTLTLGVNPTSINFGDVAVGNTDTRPVSVTNTGNSNVTITAANVTGAGFSVAGLTLPQALTPGQTVNFNAQFMPGATGAVNGSIQLVSNATTSPNTITLDGNGIAAPVGILTPSPTTVNFGDVIVGNTSAQTVMLWNTGSADVTITSAPVTGTGFSVMGLTLPMTLTPGQSSSFTAQFAPGSAGAANGNISLTSNASNSPTIVTLAGNGLAQVLTLSVNPTNISFGDVVVGATAAQSVGVTNTGNASVMITSAPVAGAAFSAAGLTLPQTLTPGQTINFNAQFMPGATGAVNGSIQLVSNATTSPNTITLDGNGIAAPVGILSTSPSTVNFGDVIVGNTSSQTVMLTNTGNADLTITSAPVTGTGFSVMGLTLPLTLMPGQSGSFTAQFAPGSAGAANGSISLTSNASNSPTNVALNGNGIAQNPQLNLNPASIDFGNVVTGSMDTRAVTVTNTGNVSVTITAANVTGAGFSVTGLALPLALNPSQSTSFNVQFAPAADGAVAGSVMLVSNAPTATLTLAGTGITPGMVTANPAMIDFGSIIVGNTDTRAVTVTNTGGASVDVTTIGISGAGFTLVGVPALPQTLAAGASLAFSIQFAPASAGAAAGSVTVTSTANSPVISLAGTGIAQTRTISLSPSTIDFGSITVGATSDQTVTMTNTGNSSVDVSAANATGTGFSVVGFSAQTLAPGQSAMFTARFSPPSTGPAAGSISLTSTATNNPTVTLSGSGQATPMGVLTLGPTSINFGSVVVGNTVQQTVTMMNTGMASLTITASNVTGAGFSITGLSLPLTLNVGQSGQFMVQFAPGAAGAVNGSVSLTSNASNSPTNVAVSGTGVAQALTISLNPSTVSYGNVTVGTTSDQTVTMTNTGNFSVNVTAANVTGAGFSIIGFAAQMLSPGQSATFTARFAPGIAGMVNGTITLTSTATNNPSVALSGTGTPPPIGTLTLNPTSISFGSVVVGNTVQQSVTMTNTGTASLTITASNATGAGFSVTGLTLPLTLNVGQSSSFMVQFAPGAAGLANGSVALTSNASNSPTNLAVSGTGVAQTLTISLNPPTISYGNVTVGTTSDQTVTMTNTGNFNVNVTAANVTGAGFSVVGFAAQMLSPGQSATFTARFAPTVAGSVNGTLTLTSTATNNPSVALSGTGTPPPTGTLTLNPASINFGSVIVGNTVQQSVTMTNTGAASLTITTSNVTGAGFSITGLTLPLTLNVGQSGTFTARFMPGAAGAVNGSVSLTSNASNSPTSLALSGTGLAQTFTLSASPTTIDFGTVIIGSASSQMITVTNTGNSAVTITSRAVTGAEFTVTGLTLPVTLNPGQSTSFSVVFMPTASGVVNGSVSLTSNASNSPTTITLAGTGMSPAVNLAVSPASINFGDIVVGSASSQSITLFNTNATDITITAINVTGTGYAVGVPDPGLDPPFPFVLGAGQSVTFGVSFTPTTSGSSSGMISIVSDASNSPSNVSLTGNGVIGINLAWDPSTSVIVGYEVLRATQMGGPYVLLNTTLVTTTMYTDRTAQSGQRYFYVARAVDATGQKSIFSNEIMVMVP